MYRDRPHWADPKGDVLVDLHRSCQADLPFSGKLDLLEPPADDVTVRAHASPSNVSRLELAIARLIAALAVDELSAGSGRPCRGSP